MHKSELWISWRYFLGYNRERFVSAISVISILGVSVGVAALIIVLAVMSGFDNDLRERIAGSNAHITVSSNFGIMFYKELQDKIAAVPGVAATSPQINMQVFLKTDNSIMSLYLRGIKPQEETKVTNVEKYILSGSLNDLTKQSDGIIIGKELADSLGLSTGDELIVISPALTENIKFKITGIFKSGMYNYDLTLGFINFGRAQELAGVANAAGAIGVRLNDLFSAPIVKKEILRFLDASYSVRTWAELNKNFFDALKLEKITMFIILSLIILVASFGIASTLIVRVSEKVKDIGILKSIGITKRGIRNIFTLQGLFIGVSGTALGVFLGVTLCLLLKKYQFVKLPQDVYYLDRLPVYLSLHDMLYVSVCALAITLLATVYPAYKAANLNTIEALRYE